MGAALSVAWAPRALLVAIPVAAVLLLVARRRRAAKAAKAAKRVQQVERVQIAPRLPGNGTPLFHGLRVVEIANTIATPMAARMLAELGAEVIKVEPLDGDPWRQWLLNYEAPRTKSSSFESANLNKSSVTANFTTPEGVRKLRDLLKDADVLITNTRPHSLEKLGLTPAEVLRDFPHLVYASLSAWGHAGAENALPGYDLGAYYAATGLATTINKPQDANVYATGFGDVATSCVMVSGIAVALRRRLVTGQGGPVTMALLRTAAFNMTPLLLVDSASDEQREAERATFDKHGPVLNGVDCAIGRAKPNYEDRHVAPALHSMYATGGKTTGVALTVDTFDAAATAAAEKALRAAFSLDVINHQTLKTALAAVEHSEVIARLTKHGVPFHNMFGMLELIDVAKSSQHPLIAPAEAFTDKLADVPDIPKWVRVPFQCHCSDDHAPRYAAPELGAHNDSIARQPWSPRLKEAELPRELPAGNDALAAKLARAPLADVIVVELAQSALAAGAGMMFADLGATVQLVEERARLAHSIRQREPLLWRSLARGKRSIAVQSVSSSEGQQTLHRLLAKANVFLCDWPIHELTPLGLDPKTLAARYPRLVVANATPFGLTADPALPSSALAAFWAASGLASLICGVPVGDISMPPPHFGELVASIQLFAGASAALFHQLRTGEGQRTDVNLLRSGLFGMSTVGLVTVVRSPEKASLFMQDPALRRINFLVPTAHCVRTKDGRWIQLLGAELPRHFWRTTKALRVPKVQFVARLLWIVLTKVLPSKKSPVQRVMPVLAEINTTFIQRVSEMTYEECLKEFAQHDVWSCPIRMPRNFRAYEQAHINGAFQVASDGAFVTSTPFDLDTLTPATALAPALGEHTE